MSNSILTINKWLHSKLSSDHRLKKMVGSQIYPIIVEENGKFPFIVFTRRSVNIEYCNDGVASESGNIVISVVAKNYIETIDIMQRVREVLEPSCDDYVSRVSVTAMEEGYYNNCFVQTMTLKIDIQ